MFARLACDVHPLPLRRRSGQPKPYKYWMFNDVIMLGTEPQPPSATGFDIHKQFLLQSLKLETPKDLRDAGLLLRDTRSDVTMRVMFGKKDVRDAFKRELGRLIVESHTLSGRSPPPALSVALPHVIPYRVSTVPKVAPPLPPPLPPPPPSLEDRASVQPGTGGTLWATTGSSPKPQGKHDSKCAVQ